MSTPCAIRTGAGANSCGENVAIHTASGMPLGRACTPDRQTATAARTTLEASSSMPAPPVRIGPGLCRTVSTTLSRSICWFLAASTAAACRPMASAPCAGTARPVPIQPVSIAANASGSARVRLRALCSVRRPSESRMKPTMPNRCAATQALMLVAAVAPSGVDSFSYGRVAGLRRNKTPAAASAMAPSLVRLRDVDTSEQPVGGDG